VYANKTDVHVVNMQWYVHNKWYVHNTMTFVKHIGY